MIGGLTRLPKQPPSRPSLVDKVGIWRSTSRYVDGLWVGSGESAPWPGLRRVEDALDLLKRYAPLHYSRVIHHLERVWVDLLIDGRAGYRSVLKACVLDERFVLYEGTTPARIAAVIVHEATHARLERWGVRYDEKIRPRIEAICLRRELSLARNFPDSSQLQEELVRTLEWCVANPDYYFDASFRERDRRGGVETLHYAGAPDWLVRILLKLRSIIFTVQKLAGRRS